MKKIIVNYQSNFDSEGRHIKQTIKLDKELLNPIQEELQRVKEQAELNCWTYFRDYTRQLSDEQINSKRSIGITNLYVIKDFLFKNNLDERRILTDRNTLIEFY